MLEVHQWSRDRLNGPNFHGADRADLGSGRRDRSRGSRDGRGQDGDRPAQDLPVGRDLGMRFGNMGVRDRLEHCLAGGCSCAAGQVHLGFGKEALKAHIDGHSFGI